jgi:DNA-binding transcriptional ArsR family regulator
MNFYLRDNYFDSEIFINFIGTPAASIYFYLLKYVVISKVDWDFRGINLYEKFYKNGDLVSRYSQEDLSLYLDMSQSQISKQIKLLNEMGFIQTLKLKIGKGKFNIYKFGEVKNDKSSLFIHEIIEKGAKSKQRADIINDLYRFGIDVSDF